MIKMATITNFHIKLEKNPNVFAKGYVKRNDELGDDIDWFAYDKQGFEQYNRIIIQNTDIDWIQGISLEQEKDIDEFQEKYLINREEINDIILQSNENDEIKRYGLIITIGDRLLKNVRRRFRRQMLTLKLRIDCEN